MAMDLAALAAVPWERLATANPAFPPTEVPVVLRRLAAAGPSAVEEDCHELWHPLVPAEGRPVPEAAVAARPFLRGLLADPGFGARTALVELLTRIATPDDRDWVPALLADPAPAVRREAIPLADGAQLLHRWQAESDPTVRIPLLLAFGEVAASADPAAAELRALLARLLTGDDPVFRLAALDASSDVDPELPVRQLDLLVELFADRTARPRFEQEWFLPGFETSFGHDVLVHRTAALLRPYPDAELAFPLRLLETGRRTGDAPLRRVAMELAWELLVQRRSPAAPLLPLAGELLDDPDGAVRLRAVNILAALGPAAARYADRLADLLEDEAEDDYYDARVCDFARWALTRIGDPRGLPGLVERAYAPYRSPEGWGYVASDPRVPELTDLLAPLRAHAAALLPELRELLRDGAANREVLAVLAAWGEDALPALPEVLPLLAHSWTASHAVQVLSAIGPAAADAEAALRAAKVLDHPGNHAFVASTALRIRGDRAAALRYYTDAVLTATDPDHGPYPALAEFGRDAAACADRVRHALAYTTGWSRVEAARVLLAIDPDGPVDEAVGALEEELLSAAAEEVDLPRSFRPALEALVGLGAVRPAVRTALRTLRRSDRRFAAGWGYQRVLADQELCELIDRALGTV
ncbi:HEAT repeat domain-containing protein [Kitasatospora sp. NPDC006697]|uniref:HEAT repeat domain-containing protein n=1 Tax=Kitasatospora sp. NPDC006697 TaxID=3364020 RepID=UPI00368EBAD9